MTNFSIFESNLRGYFDGNVKRSHIEDLIEEGYDSVLLTIGERGSIVLRFRGKYSSRFSFRDLAQFHRESENWRIWKAWFMLYLLLVILLRRLLIVLSLKVTV